MPSSFAKVVFPWDCLPVSFCFCEVVYLWGCLPMKSSSCEAIIMWDCLPVTSSSCEVVFLWGRLPVKSFSFEVLFLCAIILWGIIPVRINSVQFQLKLPAGAELGNMTQTRICFRCLTCEGQEQVTLVRHQISVCKIKLHSRACRHKTKLWRPGGNVLNIDKVVQDL